MTILVKKRVQFLLVVVGIIVLSITAEKFRLLVGEEAASKSGKFTFLNCFDGSSGTLACVVKEGVKLYFYNIRTLHVESRRNEAIEAALAEAISQGLAANEAAKLAQKEGAKAAKLATRKAKRIIGPIISSGWDFFEAIYFGGSITEGFLRGTGTLFGTYYLGFLAEERFGRFGYLVGSHLGSWVGGRVGLMVYDIVSGVHFMMGETRVYDADFLEKTDADEGLYEGGVESGGESDESGKYKAPFEGYGSAWGSSNTDELSYYEALADDSVIAHEEL